MYDSEVLYRGLYRSYRICVNKILRLRERLAVSPERERSPRRRHRRRNRHRPRPAWVTNLHTGRPATASGRDGGDARPPGRREHEQTRDTGRPRGARAAAKTETRALMCAGPRTRAPEQPARTPGRAGPSPWRRACVMACVRTAQHGLPPPLVVVTLEIVTDSPIPPHSRPRQHTPGGPRREYRIRQ